MGKFIVFLLLVLPRLAFAQTKANPCNFQWQPWEQAHAWQGGSVSYAFQSADCIPNGGICGWPKIAIRHAFPQDARISVTLEGIDCHGKLTHSSAASGFNKLPSGQEYNSDGNWHTIKQVTGIVRVEASYKVGDDLYEAVYDRDRGIDKLTINGLTREEIADAKEKAEKEQKEREKAEEEKDKAEEKQRQKARDETAEKDRKEKEKRDAEIRNRESEQRAAVQAAETPQQREMRLRSEAQQRKDEAEKKATDATVAGIGSILELAIENTEDDTRSYEKSTIYMKLNAGLSANSIPVVSNEINNTIHTNQSLATTASPFSIHLGVLLSAFNSKLLSIQANPFYNYGVSDGNHQSYGTSITTAVGHRFKVLGKAEYANRSGSMTKDYATAGVDFTTSSEYDYSVLRYGIGGRLLLGDESLVLEATAFRDRISFLENSPARIYSYEAKLITSFLCAGFSYGRNYPVAGKLLYVNGYDDASQNLSMVTLCFPLTLLFKE